MVLPTVPLVSPESLAIVFAKDTNGTPSIIPLVVANQGASDSLLAQKGLYCL